MDFREAESFLYDWPDSLQLDRMACTPENGSHFDLDLYISLTNKDEGSVRVGAVGDFVVFLAQLGINQDVNEAPIFASGHGHDAAIIAAAGMVIGNGLISFPLSRFGYAMAERRNIGGWPSFLLDHVASLGNFIDYVLSVEDQAEAALTNIIQVGTSAGGACAKAVIAWNPETHQIRSGQFDVPAGFPHWLLKFDGVGKDLASRTGQDYGRIEYAYHRMALAAGIEMSPCRLLEEHGRAHFMTRRFDREDNKGKSIKHHLQTLCGLDNLDYKQQCTLGALEPGRICLDEEL